MSELFEWYRVPKPSLSLTFRYSVQYRGKIWIEFEPEDYEEVSEQIVGERIEKLLRARGNK